MIKAFIPSNALMAGDREWEHIQIKQEKLDDELAFKLHNSVQPQQATASNTAPVLKSVAFAPHVCVKNEPMDNAVDVLESSVHDCDVPDYPGVKRLFAFDMKVCGSKNSCNTESKNECCVRKSTFSSAVQEDLVDTAVNVSVKKVKSLTPSAKTVIDSSPSKLDWTMSEIEESTFKLLENASCYSLRDVDESLNYLNKKYGPEIDNYYFRLFHPNPKLQLNSTKTSFPSTNSYSKFPGNIVEQRLNFVDSLGIQTSSGVPSSHKDVPNISNNVPSSAFSSAQLCENATQLPEPVVNLDMPKNELKMLLTTTAVTFDNYAIRDPMAGTSEPEETSQPNYRNLPLKRKKEIHEIGSSKKPKKIDHTSEAYMRGGELFILIVSWRTDWLDSADDYYPPISNQIQFKSVKNTYSSNDEYKCTYCGLHLLSIWCIIKNSYQSKPEMLVCTFENFEEKNFYFKNKCSHICVKANMPTHQSIILGTYTVNGHQRRLFGYVYEVQAKKYQPPDADDSLKKVLFSFYTNEKIEAPLKTTVYIQNITKARVLLKQYEALVFGKKSALRTIVINPAENCKNVRTLSLPPVCHSLIFKMVDPFTDKIYESVVSSGGLITLVKKPVAKESFFVLSVLRKFIGKCPILVCFKDVEKLHSVVLKVRNKEVCLAVKESETKVADDLKTFTLRNQARKLKKDLEDAQKQVLQRSKVVFTVLSNMFLGESQDLKQSVCIVDDAHLVTEAETSLILNLTPKSVVLLGAPDEYAELDLSLQKLNYHTTLFHRLYEYSQENIVLGTETITKTRKMSS